MNRYTEIDSNETCADDFVGLSPVTTIGATRSATKNASSTFLMGIRGSLAADWEGPVHDELRSTGVDTQRPKVFSGASAILQSAFASMFTGL